MMRQTTNGGGPCGRSPIPTLDAYWLRKWLRLLPLRSSTHPKGLQPAQWDAQCRPDSSWRNNFNS